MWTFIESLKGHLLAKKVQTIRSHVEDSVQQVLIMETI